MMKIANTFFFIFLALTRGPVSSAGKEFLQVPSAQAVTSQGLRGVAGPSSRNLGSKTGSGSYEAKLMLTGSSTCSKSNENTAYGQLTTSNTPEYQFCVVINDLNFWPTTATLRGDSPFQDRNIDCYSNSNGFFCQSCYRFSNSDVHQLNGSNGGLQVVLAKNENCRIKGKLRKN